MKVPRGRIQNIQIAVAGKFASYMDSFYFAAIIEKITQKLLGRKVGGRWRGHGPLGHPLNPRMVIRQHPASHACILSIPNLDSIFFRSLLPSVPRFNIFPFGF